MNAGIYVLNPEMLSIIPKETYFDMPSLFTAAIAKGFSTVAFPLREYWMDIGNKEDLSQAQCDFVNHFYSKES